MRRIETIFAVLCALFVGLAAAPASAQLRVELPQPTQAVQQASSVGSSAGIIAARLEASRGAQIRVTATFLSVDAETRKAIYDLVGHEAITTNHTRVPLGPAETASQTPDEHTSSYRNINTTSVVSTGVIDHNLTSKILGLVAAAEHSSVAMSPSLILLDGQSANYNDMAQRPFVVGVKTTAGATSPIVEVFEEGTQIHFEGSLAEWKPDTPTRIELKGQISWQSILDVKSEPVFGFDAQPAKVQIPYHLIKSVSVSRTLGEDQVLLLDPYVGHKRHVASEKRVPVLNKLPYVGRGFKRGEGIEIDQNVMVLIRPSTDK